LSFNAFNTADFAACLDCEMTHSAEMDALGGNPHPSAVLLPLFRHKNSWHLLFIRRTENERDPHSGQVAFPGGRTETHDTNPVATALRESMEEIGLPPADVEVLGEMGTFHTVSNHLVSPVVGCIPWPLELRHNPSEVARVFSIPLSWLSQPEHYRIENWPKRGHPKARPVVFFDRYDGELLWGVSARITLDFIERLRSL